jgi:hypothetical protein
MITGAASSGEHAEPLRIFEGLLVHIGQIGLSKVRWAPARPRTPLGTGGSRSSPLRTRARPTSGSATSWAERRFVEFRRLAVRVGVHGPPALIYFLGPQLATFLPGRRALSRLGTRPGGERLAFIVRPIAVGGMLVGAALHDVPHASRRSERASPAQSAELSAKPTESSKTERTERYMASKTVFLADRDHLSSPWRRCTSASPA